MTAFVGIIIAIILALDLLALGAITVMMLVEAVKLPIALAVIGGFVGVFLVAFFVSGPAPVAIITNGIIMLVLGALGITMMIGAIIGKRSTITSWPMQQEQSFVPYERRQASSHSFAMMFAIMGGAVVFFTAIGIYVGVEPETRDLGKSMNMSNLTKKSRSVAPAPTPDTPKADAPKTDAPKADAPKTDAPKSDAPAPKAEAPAPAPAPKKK
jgi:hypothetical protein